MGAPLLVILPAWVISIGLGLLTVQFVVDQAFRRSPPISAGVERRLAPVAGFFSGLSNGAIGAAGPVAGSFLLSLGLRGPEFVFGISTVFTFVSGLRFVLFAVAGQYTSDLLLLAGALLVPAMLGQAVGTVIEKVRHEVAYKGFTWEVDVYGGRYSGLVVAEVELRNETDRPEIPDWIGREVTGDYRYSNQAMALSEGALRSSHEPQSQSG